MKSSAALLTLCAALYGWVARAQEGFIIPSPDVSDFDSSLAIIQGEIAEFVWSANATYQPTLDGQPIMQSDGRASLWITSFEGDEDRFGKLITPSVISAGRASWAWKVDLTDAEIDRWKGRFNYRIMKPVSSSNAAFVDTMNTVPSRGFIVRKKLDVVSSILSVSASYSRFAAASQSSSAQTASTLSTQTLPATNSATPTTTTGGPGETSSSNTKSGSTSSQSPSSENPSRESASSGGLSAGAKAGVAIGCIVIVILGAIAVLLFLRHRRRANNAVAPNTYYNDNFQEKPASEVSPVTTYRHEAPSTGHEAYEMPAQQEHEYKAELAGSQGKPQAGFR